MIPGHGKDHCYFSGGPFEDEKVESGVHAKLPVEIVVDTKGMLEAGCEIFMTESEGFLTASMCLATQSCSPVATSRILVSGREQGGGYYGQGDESPARAEADEPIDIVLGQGSSSADAPTDDPQQPPLPAATEGTLAILDAVPPIEVDLKEPERERNATDESLPSVTERPTMAR